MHITLSPQRRDGTLAVEVTGDRIRINADLFNFNPLAEGDSVNAEDIPCDFLTGMVTRTDGEIRLTLLLPHGTAPEQWQAFPEPISVTRDGPVDLPFDTWSETVEQAADGGKNIVTTIHRWHQPDQVSTVFIADPPPADKEEDTADVDVN